VPRRDSQRAVQEGVRRPLAQPAALVQCLRDYGQCLAVFDVFRCLAGHERRAVRCLLASMLPGDELAAKLFPRHACRRILTFYGECSIENGRRHRPALGEPDDEVPYRRFTNADVTCPH